MATTTAVQKEIPAIARDQKDPATTVQLFRSTKLKLDELKAALLDDGSGSYDDLLNALIRKATREPGEIDEDLAAELTERIEKLEKVVTMLCADPKNGYLFSATSAERGIDGEAGEVVPGGFLEADTIQPGAYVQAPSGSLLSEQNGLLPKPVIQLVQKEEKKRRDAAAILEKKGRA